MPDPMSHKQRALVLEQALRSLMKGSYEYYRANDKRGNEANWDEFDYFINPLWYDAEQAIEVAGRMTRGVADA